MKVIIFNDKNNFEGSLRFLNNRKKKGEKRFWRIELYSAYLFKKLTDIFSWKSEELKLIKNYIYTGEYNSKILVKHRKYCKKEIQSLNNLIREQKDLISKLSTCEIDRGLKEKLQEHLNEIKELFEGDIINFNRDMEKQKRNSEGQKSLFERLRKMPLTKYKTTPLKHAKGDIYQKGVDVQIATDLVHLAHVHAYDIALIFGGDTDLIESIKLVRDGLGKIVVVVAYYDEENPLQSSISKDFINRAEFDFFINLRDFGDSDIENMSELLRQKEEKINPPQ